jgi:hypothetical protein
MSRQVYRLGVGLALVGVALAFTDRVISLRPRVTEAKIHRIQVGMTLREIRAILGSEGTCISSLKHLPPRQQPWVWEWEEEGRAILVTIEEDRVVERARFLILRSEKPSPLARLRAWLGW